MADAVGRCVLGGVSAAVVGLLVVPGAFHASTADPTKDQTAQQVGTGGASGFASHWPVRSGGAPFSDRRERVDVDDRLVCLGRAPYPIDWISPPLCGAVAEGHIVNVDEHLVAWLAVPDH